MKRRRILPLASTTVAALGFAGCAMGGSAEATPREILNTESASVALTPQQQLERRVRDFTTGMDVALDKVDRERLRAAAEKKNLAAVSAPAAQQPASAPPSAVQSATAQTPVVLASSGAAEAAPATAAPLPAVAHAAPEAHPPAVPALTLKTQIHPAAPMSGVTVGLEPETAVPALKIAPVVEAAPVKPAAAPAAAVLEETHAPAAAIITPVSPPTLSAPAAMGSMTAMVTPAAAEAVVAPTVQAVVQAPVEPTIDDALAVVRKKIAAHPTLGTALGLALLDTGDGKAGEVAKTLPEADQKVLADLLAALQGMNGTTGGSVADRAAPLVEASKKWQAQADLALPRLVLATRVDSFGVYKEVEPKFEQGKRHTVIIYCEVANFGSKKGDDGWFQTRLAQQETLITEDGLLLWRPNAEEVEDRSMNQRKDFYLVKKLTIPENLAVGKYTLQMKVTDRNADKFSLVSLPIEIVSK